MKAPRRTPAERASWQHDEGGGRFAIWFIRNLGLYGGRRMARLLLWPITLYFHLRRGDERRGIRRYLERLHGRPARRAEALRVLHAFSATLLDRVFLLARGAAGFEFHVEGLEQFDTVLAQGRGLLLVGAHFGSFEVLRSLALTHASAPLHIVLDKQATPELTRLLEELAPDLAAMVIDIARGGPEATLAMADALAQGHMVGLLADRARAGERCLPAPFLGAPAPFPVTPWLLAGALDVPVMLCFAAYAGGNRYHVHFESFAERIRVRREEREADLDAVVRRYAAALEQQVRAWPDNWFNFHDFWALPPAAVDVSAGKRA